MQDSERHRDSRGLRNLEGPITLNQSLPVHPAPPSQATAQNLGHPAGRAGNAVRKRGTHAQDPDRLILKFPGLTQMLQRMANQAPASNSDVEVWSLPS